MISENAIFYSLISCLIFLTLISCKGQENLKHSQIRYYETIYLAERALLDSDINLAYNLYKKAFDFNCRTFAKDHYNFAKIGCEIDKKIDESILFLLSRGISLQYLKKDDCLKDYIKNLETDKTINLKIEKSQATFSQNTNFTLRSELDSIFTLDQKYRILDIEKDGKGNNDYIVEIDSTNNIVINAFLDLCSEYGFPNEEILGFNDTFPEPLRYNFFFPLIHQSNLKKTVNLTELIKKAVLDGNLHPEIAAAVLDNHNDSRIYYFSPSPIFKVMLLPNGKNIREMSKMEYYEFQKDYPYYTKPIPDSLELVYNANRKELGLPTCKEFFSLLKLRNRDTGLKYIWNESAIFFAVDSNNLKRFLDGAIKIEDYRNK